MAFRDYFKFLSTEKYGDIDYVLVFRKNKVDISMYPKLLSVGKWNKYGRKGYRVVCRLSKSEFVELVASEVGINREDFYIARTVEFVGL